MALLLCLLLAGAQPRFVQTALSLRLDVDYAKPALAGTAALTLENRGAPSEEASLLLGRLMQVKAVRSAGAPLRFEQLVVVFEDDPMRQVLQLRAHLPKAVASGERVELEIDWSGPLVGYTETGSLYIRDRIDPAFTILRRDAFAFPVPGVPSRAANRSLREPDFAFTAAITVPREQVVAAGGRLVSRTALPGGRARWEFHAPSAPFLNVVIAPYAVREAGGVRVLALPADAARIDGLFEATARALGLLEQWYGPLGREPNLSIAEIPAGFGSQASLTGGLIVDSRAFTDLEERRQLYHELTHLWNAPDLDQPSPRWNEGLATYLEFRLAREIDGVDEVDTAARRIRTRLCDAAAKDARLRTIAFRRYGEQGMTDFSYTVGFSMFAELEARLGAAALTAALGELFQRHKEHGATSEDLRNALCAHAPAAVVEGIWTRWMTTTEWVQEVCGR